MSDVSHNLDPEGWMSFDYTILHGLADRPLMIADEIICDYVLYVWDCHQRKSSVLSFGEWLTCPPGKDFDPLD